MIRRIAAISSCTAIGQLVQFAAFLYLARELGPSDFGYYGAYMGLLALTTALGALRMELSFGLLVGRQRLLAATAMVGSIASAIALVAGVLVAVVSSASMLRSGLFGYGTSATTIGVLIGSGTATLIIGEALTYLSLRVGSWASVAAYALCRPLFIGSFQLALVALSSTDGSDALILGAILGQSLALGAYVPTIRKVIGWRSARRTWILCLAIGRKFGYLARSQAPQQLMSRVGLNALPIVLPIHFGSQVGGFYGVSNRVLCTPSQVLGKVLRGVYFSEAAERIRSGRGISRLHSVSTLSITILAGFYFIPVAAFSDELVKFVFGSEWVGAAPILMILSVFWWSALINIPSSALIAPMGLDVWYLKYETSLLAARVAAIAIGVLASSYLLIMTIFSLAGLIFNAILIWKVRVAVRQRCV